MRLLYILAYCQIIARADPTLNPEGEGGHESNVAQWQQEADQAMSNARAELPGEWPQFGTSDEEWAKIRDETNRKHGDPQHSPIPERSGSEEAPGPLQCLPIQRYRDQYLKGAPDRDIAICSILMFTPKKAPHLEPFTAEELFHCGHCALLDGLHRTALHYFRRARENATDTTAAINYGTALYLAGNIAESLTEWRRVVEMDPIPNKLHNTEVAIKNLAFASSAAGQSAEVTRELLLKLYEQAWIRTVLNLVGQAAPDSFVQEQVFRPLGIWRDEAMRSFQTETPEILGQKWTLQSHEISPGITELAVLYPPVQPRSAPAAGSISAQGSPALIGTSPVDHTKRRNLVPISIADTTSRALNLYEFGLNRELCHDPMMDRAPEPRPLSVPVLQRHQDSYVLSRAGRRYLATMKRSLVGFMDQAHPAAAIQEWGRGASSRSSAHVAPASALAHAPTSSMSLSLATLNRLNHSRYMDPPFPGFTLATIGMLNHLQAVIEDVLAHGVQGDFMEAGVWRGGQTILMRAVLEAASEPTRHVWVCDSFDGVPAPRAGTTAAEDETVDWKPGLYNASLDIVQANFVRFGLLDSRVHFVKGHFIQSMKTIEVQKIAVLRLDADTWDATSDVLDAVYHRVSEGGYVIVDDFHLNGARGAVLEFRKKHGITEPLLPVPEDYVFACGQHKPEHYHTWPKKAPQAAYWRKGRARTSH